jgi:hypothetical protein
MLSLLFTIIVMVFKILKWVWDKVILASLERFANKIIAFVAIIVALYFTGILKLIMDLLQQLKGGF